MSRYDEDTLTTHAAAAVVGASFGGLIFLVGAVGNAPWRTSLVVAAVVGLLVYRSGVMYLDAKAGK